jgi:hypothetical protein
VETHNARIEKASIKIDTQKTEWPAS